MSIQLAKGGVLAHPTRSAAKGFEGGLVPHQPPPAEPTMIFLLQDYSQ